MRTSPHNREKLAPQSRLNAMADAMTEIAKLNGSVSRDQLICRGFSPIEIDRFRDQAGAIAGGRISGEI